MERYTPQERGIIVSIFLNNNRSVVLAQREYRRRFPNRTAPTGQTFRRLATRFEQTGTTEDLAGRGRHRTGRSAENIAAVAADIAENVGISIRRRAAQLGINRRTLQRILVEDLHMFPYEGQKVHPRTDAVVLAKAPTNSTKKSTNKKRASSKASKVEVNSTAVKNSKPSKRKVDIKEEISQVDILPATQFIVYELEEGYQLQKPFKTKGSRKQLKEVEPVLVEEDASNHDEQEDEPLGERKRRMTATKKVDRRKVVKRKKDIETEDNYETISLLD